MNVDITTEQADNFKDFIKNVGYSTYKSFCLDLPKAEIKIENGRKNIILKNET